MDGRLSSKSSIMYDLNYRRSYKIYIYIIKIWDIP